MATRNVSIFMIFLTIPDLGPCPGPGIRTRARVPGPEILKEESWRRNLGGTLEGESWRRNSGGGILEEDSWIRNLGGILEEKSWRKNSVHSFCASRITRNLAQRALRVHPAVTRLTVHRRLSVEA